MKVSLNWLREFLPPSSAVDTAAAASALTMVGLEVEGIEEKGRGHKLRLHKPVEKKAPARNLADLLEASVNATRKTRASA